MNTILVEVCVSPARAFGPVPGSPTRTEKGGAASFWGRWDWLCSSAGQQSPGRPKVPQHSSHVPKKSFCSFYDPSCLKWPDALHLKDSNTLSQSKKIYCHISVMGRNNVINVGGFDLNQKFVYCIFLKGEAHRRITLKSKAAKCWKRLEAPEKS